MNTDTKFFVDLGKQTERSSVDVIHGKNFITGFGGVVSFSLIEDTEAAATQCVTSTKLFKLAESLGGVKSLLCHPASMTHKSIPVHQRHTSGIADSLIRLSVGLEDVQDLVTDLGNALELLKTASAVSSNGRQVKPFAPAI